jgi:hypothetical protein
MHEAMQTLVRLDDLEAGPQNKWKVLPSTISAPMASRSSGVMALTVP